MTAFDSGPSTPTGRPVPGPRVPTDGARGRDLVAEVRAAIDIPIPPGPDKLSDQPGAALEALAEVATRLEHAHERLSEALSAVDKT